MRIIGGWARSRRLRAPAGAATRPTADRVREAVFNILGPPAPETRVLDLFAGAGGLGLEAMSRGAAEAVFVERAAPALKCLRENIAALDLGGATEVLAMPIERALRRLAERGRPFHWIFADPPYAGDLADRALASLGASPLVEGSGAVIVEHDRRRMLPETAGALERRDRRVWGDTAVSFYGKVGA